MSSKFYDEEGAFNSFFMVPSETVDKRMNICKECPHLTRMHRCRKCGCLLKLKILFTHTNCPLRRWSSA